MAEDGLHVDAAGDSQEAGSLVPSPPPPAHEREIIGAGVRLEEGCLWRGFPRRPPPVGGRTEVLVAFSSGGGDPTGVRSNWRSKSLVSSSGEGAAFSKAVAVIFFF
nr:hypothetical protein Iba_chr14dCG4690 [Ipomoea batatas]GMD93584.1 hypothetical protein Iba_chr14fCG8850 [Ipomoea batatas]